MNIEILVGPPGCGKSTKAEEYKRNGYVYINQDTQGKGHLGLFNEAIIKKQKIVVDRMNFNKEQRSRYLDPAKEKGYTTGATLFRVPKQTCLDRCSTRENHPTVKTEEDASRAVNFFFSKFEMIDNEVDNLTIEAFDSPYRRSAIVCDLDGTLCNIDHRLHYVRGAEGKKPNWDRFFRAMGRDDVNNWCEEILAAIESIHEIVYCTGRPEEYREEVMDWLAKKGLHIGPLFMRSRGDYRRDDVVKEQILDFDILTQFDPLFFIDDRQQVVDMWRRRGFICLQCAPGNF